MYGQRLFCKKVDTGWVERESRVIAFLEYNNNTIIYRVRFNVWPVILSLVNVSRVELVASLSAVARVLLPGFFYLTTPRVR